MQSLLALGVRFQEQRASYLEQTRSLGGKMRVPKINGTFPVEAIASSPAFLVPIRLDIDFDGYKIRDSFVWALPADRGPAETGSRAHDDWQHLVEEFCHQTSLDFDVPSGVAKLMGQSIREQLMEAREASCIIESAGGLAVFRGMRVILRLDITVGLERLTDAIEWDLGDADTGVPDFARTLVRDIFYVPAWGTRQQLHTQRAGNPPATGSTPGGGPSSAPGLDAQYTPKNTSTAQEFEGAIMIDILDQLYRLRRAIALVGFTRSPQGHFLINDPELNALVQRPADLGSCKRAAVGRRRDPNRLDEFTPVVQEIDPLELERIEISRERESRRRRRQGRLPTKKVPANTHRGPEASLAQWTHLSPPKTMRTPVSYRGSLHRIVPRVEDDDDHLLEGGPEAGGRTPSAHPNGPRPRGATNPRGRGAGGRGRKRAAPRAQGRGT